MIQAKLEDMTMEFPDFIKWLKKKLENNIFIEEPDLLGRKECPMMSYPLLINGKRIGNLNLIYGNDEKTIVSKTAGFSRESALGFFPDVNILYNVGSVILIAYVGDGKVDRKDDFEEIPFP